MGIFLHRHKSRSDTNFIISRKKTGEWGEAIFFLFLDLVHKKLKNSLFQEPSQSGTPHFAVLGCTVAPTGMDRASAGISGLSKSFW